MHEPSEGGGFLLLGLLLNGPAIVTAINSKGTITPQTPLYYLLLTPLYSYLLLNPLYIIFTYAIYRSLKQFKKDPPTQADEKRRRKTIIIFSIIGILALLIMTALIIFAMFVLPVAYSTINQASTPYKLQQPTTQPRFQ